MTLIIGTAGWTIPAEARDQFPADGTSLERYSAVFRGVEINSSFHRSHRASTWARWAESVPDDFRFSVKVPKTITHQRKLVGCDDLLTGFLEEVSPLGDKLAVLLVQLPPSLAFDPVVAGAFLDRLRAGRPALALEPRHPSWFAEDADAMLTGLRIARVAADPAVVPAAAEPGGWRGLAYWRLHGSPRMYRSSYDDGRIPAYAQALAAVPTDADAWCIFDNTASSAATGDALALGRLLQEAA